ncbi:Maf family protein [Thiovibrio sp. JS02]
MSGLFHATAPLVLASGSPRRRDFLAGLGLAFIVQKADIDESPRAGEKACAFVARLAGEKAAAVAERHPTPWVLAADTVVVADDQILGKPRDADEALEMLLRLSGRWHEVWTGFCLRQGGSGRQVAVEVRTRVRFMALDPVLCSAYVRTGEPLDKAGAYGIQGKGAFLVEEIEGSYTNVVGLPLAEVLAELLRFGVIAPNSDGIVKQS